MAIIIIVIIIISYCCNEQVLRVCCKPLLPTELFHSWDRLRWRRKTASQDELCFSLYWLRKLVFCSRMSITLHPLSPCKLCWWRLLASLSFNSLTGDIIWLIISSSYQLANICTCLLVTTDVAGLSSDVDCFLDFFCWSVFLFVFSLFYFWCRMVD